MSSIVSEIEGIVNSLVSSTQSIVQEFEECSTLGSTQTVGNVVYQCEYDTSDVRSSTCGPVHYNSGGNPVCNPGYVLRNNKTVCCELGMLWKATGTLPSSSGQPPFTCTLSNTPNTAPMPCPQPGASHFPNTGLNNPYNPVMVPGNMAEFNFLSGDGRILMTVPFACPSGYLVGFNANPQSLLCLKNAPPQGSPFYAPVPTQVPGVSAPLADGESCANGSSVMPIYSSRMSISNLTGVNATNSNVSTLIGYGCVDPAAIQGAPTQWQGANLNGCSGAQKCSYPNAEDSAWVSCDAPGWDPDCQCAVQFGEWNAPSLNTSGPGCN